MSRLTPSTRPSTREPRSGRHRGLQRVSLAPATGALRKARAGDERPPHLPCCADHCRAALRCAGRGWGDARRLRLETAIAAATIVPVSDALISEAAELRFECRRAGHPLAAESHAADLWIAASARHISAPLLSADSIFENAPGVARVTL